MEYLIANGVERVVDELREQAYQIQALLDFEYIEPNGKDQGINVQKKAQSILALINDRGKIRELRQTAAANRDKYRGLSSTGLTFKSSSYLSTSGSYDEEQYGGGSSMKEPTDDVDGKEHECRPQRDEYHSCGEREHNESCASSKGGDPNSDKGSSTEGERSHDTDEYRQYSRAPGNRAVVAAVTRAQTNLSQSSSVPTSKRRDLFFNINPADENIDDDFDPRGTSKCPVPLAKVEFSVQSQNALEDLFADVEFQTSYPPISSPASNNVLDQDYLQTFTQASKPNCIPQLLPPFNGSTKAEFQPFNQTLPDKSLSEGPSFGSFNPSFASFDESPKSTTHGVLPNGGFHSNSNNFSAREQFKMGSSTLGSPSKTADSFGSFNPFSTMEPGTETGNSTAQQQQQLPHKNPFLSTTSSSAFWDDPLITSLVDLSIGPKQDQIAVTAPLRMMNEISANNAPPTSAVSRANSLPVGAPTLSTARHMNSSISLGRSVSDLPKSS